MILLADLLKEVIGDEFFNDKIPLRLPSVIAKDIKKLLQGIDLWYFAWREANFDDRGKTYKKYDDSNMGGGSAGSIAAIKKSDFNNIVSAIKNNKIQDRLNSYAVKEEWPTILQSGKFLKFLKDTNSYDRYKTTIDDMDWFKFSDITADIWNKNKQKEFSTLKVKGAYYHVSANDKLKPGDIIKPYFNSEEYIKTMIGGGGGMSRGVEFAAKIIEDVLEENRPSTAPSRNKTTYVFKAVGDAVEYLHGGDRPIYAVEVKGDVYFVDMSIVDEMNYEVNFYVEEMEMADDQEQYDVIHREFESKLNILAKQYWAKKASKDPVWEGLTKEDIVVIRRVK